ncbi:MAG TPA: transglycosylase domain-containing protein [Jiangellaceae bacterium]|jgi:membrane peptidoglycan carboxypeptidase|nr:transglycosylase domain-containing protein [Jiangellaceae bacterium]
MFRLDVVIAAFRRTLLIIGVSGLAGVLIAGIALPVAASLGLAARESADAFNEMPADLDIQPLAERSRILDSSGHTLAFFYEQNRRSIPLAKIAPVMRDAILAIEDHRFYEHGPIDLRGTARAFISNLDAGEVTGGGSTLTQQYVKLVLFNQAKTDAERREAVRSTGAQGYVRKLRELRLAAAIEDEYTKDQILERYLNIAFFGGGGGSGGGAYGIEAAARLFFGTRPDKLTLKQAALLAGLVQAPSEYNPIDNPEKAIGRRNQVVTRMAELGMVTPQDAREVRQSELGLDVHRLSNTCLPSWAPFFCDYVVHEIRQMKELGDTPEERERKLMRSGLTIVTSLDRQAQHAAQEAMSDRVDPRDSAVGTMAMVEPGTGYIKAIANSREYGQQKGQTYINYAVDKKMGSAGGSNGIQAGSAFKPFVLAAAIRQGISLNTTIEAPQELDMGGEKFRVCEETGETVYTVEQGYRPKNSTGSGRFNLKTGTERSVNTFYVQLLQKTGICEPAMIAQKAGIFKQTAENPEGEPLDQVASFTLGANTVSPLAMAEGYAMFAARGVHCKSIAVLEVRSRGGKVLAKREPACDRVLDTGVADGVNFVLRGVIENPGATGNRMRLDDGRQAAGKTGTTNKSVAVWFAGYTPQLAAAVAVADLDGRQTTLDGREYNGETIWSACGGCIPGPIWKQAMDDALEGVPEESFGRPDPTVVQGINEAVPDVRGMEVEAASQRLSELGFGVHLAGDVASALAKGLVVETDPPPGTEVASGSSVGLFVSTGQPEPEPGTPPPPEPGDPGRGGGRLPIIPPPPT